ncbi:hypothetical protein QF037_004384 [Streptomyces canus]|nr:hypothetical protein [Streptomyces canus]
MKREPLASPALSKRSLWGDGRSDRGPRIVYRQMSAVLFEDADGLGVFVTSEVAGILHPE